MTTTTRKARIEAALKSLEPTHLEVIDDSGKHAGHSGARPEGETHYTIRIIAPTFAGKSRVAAHREINALLANEFATGLHALAIEARGA
ncbi:MAG: BolA family transcriptional regulator [Proteobacteria bacterium]|nr:BolA family transcriptional regulator [Pseudomonadota bacterium]